MIDKEKIIEEVLSAEILLQQVQGQLPQQETKI